MNTMHANKDYTARLQSIDFMRGLVIVIMALDHVRDYVHASTIDPMNLEETNLWLFLTRWITHLCAPVFVILAGVSAGLLAKKLTKFELTQFLLTRGVWLIFIELTLVSVAWDFNFLAPDFFLGFQVIWALGVSMIALAGLIWLPRPSILVIALLLIFGHNAFDGLLPTNNWSPENSPMPFWWSVHVTGFVEIFGIQMFVAYPIVPWVGVMALGYFFASIFELEAEHRKRVLLRFGISSLILFVILRGFNIYGDPSPWEAQENIISTLQAILNVEKYPPSLSYLLATLGVSALIMYLAEHGRSTFHDWMVNFGKVPFFFYVVHLYFIHLIALGIAIVQGSDLGIISRGFYRFPETHGVNLAGTYLIWIGVVVVLYFPCKKFVRVKSTNKSWWLKYL